METYFSQHYVIHSNVLEVVDYVVILCVLSIILFTFYSVTTSKHALFHPGSKQNMQGNIQNSIHSSFSSVWLTQLQPPVTEVDPPSYEHLRQYPNTWASGSGSALRFQCPTDCSSWSCLPLINDHMERREDKGRQKRQEASSDSQDENQYLQNQRKKVNSSGTKPGKARLHSY